MIKIIRRTVLRLALRGTGGEHRRPVRGAYRHDTGGTGWDWPA